ncbi:hypothetical protein OROMI_029603 [Orobanche minor]
MDYGKKDNFSFQLTISFSDFLLLRHRSRIGVPINPALDRSCFSIYRREYTLWPSSRGFVGVLSLTVSRSINWSDLPDDSHIHPVFHVSLLKPAVGQVAAAPTLPEDLLAVDPPFLPDSIMDSRRVERDGVDVEQLLVRWSGFGADEDSWMDVADFRGQFPDFDLADKVVSTGGAIDSGAQPPIRVYQRRKKRQAAA